MSKKLFQNALREQLVESSDKLNQALEPILQFVDRQAILQHHSEAMEIEAAILTAENEETAEHFARELNHKNETIRSAITEGRVKAEWEAIYEREKTIQFLKDLLLESAEKLAPVVKDLAVEHGLKLLGGK